jgi:alanine racemase
MSFRNEITARVQLDHLRHNIRVISDKIAPAKIIGVVKADGYGHGSVHISQVMAEEGVAMLAVAVVDEAIELRDAGITLPILILDKVWKNQLNALFRYNLQPPIASQDDLQMLSRAAEEREQILPVQFKIDTGMGRLGFYYENFFPTLEQVKDHRWLKIAGIMSHLATADELENELVDIQRNRFKKIVESVRQVTGESMPYFHLANSAGALFYEDLRYDYVRLGLSLYGISPVQEAGLSQSLKPVMEFRTTVAYVKNFPENSPIGYGSAYRTKKDSKIAVCAGGYEDGIPRRYGNIGEVLIHGKKFPIVGNVSMDTFMIDIGREPVAVGDTVVILGQQDDVRITVWDMAQSLELIPYEVLCGISPRVLRNYFNG